MRRVLGSLLVLFLVILAGCGGGGSKNETTATAETPKSAPAAENKVENKEPIVLAGIVSLSGLNASLGEADKAAMEIAADDINKAGGVLGRPVKLIFFDEYSEPAETMAKLKAEKAFAVVGFDNSGQAIKYQPEIMKEKMIMMVSGAGSPALTESVTKDPATNKYLFRNGNHARDWARTAAVYMKDFVNAKSYFYFSQDNAFGKSLEPILADLVKNDGIKPVGSFYFKRGETNFSDALDQVMAAKPDVIISYVGPTGGDLAKAYAEKKIPVPLFDIAAGSYEAEDKVKVEMGDNVNNISLALFAADVDITSKTKPFYAAFKAKTGKSLGGLFDVRAADGVAILAQAIEQAGVLDTDKVIEALEKKTYTGVAGNYEFDASHQAKWSPSLLGGLIGQWQNGKLEIIWPEHIKSAAHSKAAWWQLASN